MHTWLARIDARSLLRSQGRGGLGFGISGLGQMMQALQEWCVGASVSK